MKRMNKNNYRRLLYGLAGALLLPGLSGCAKTDPSPAEPSDGLRPLSVSADIELRSAGGADTRAITTSFANNNQVGMYICDHETGTPTAFIPQMNGYDNLLMQRTASTGTYPQGWYFRLNGTSTNLPEISIKEEGHVDVYAYYPYNSSTSAPTAVPFTSGKTDYLWAELTAPVAGSRAIYEPDYNFQGYIPLGLRFRHAMTCLHFQIRVNYTGSLIVKSLELVDTKGTSRIRLAGTFSAVDGSITSTTTAGNSLKNAYTTNNTITQTGGREPGYPNVNDDPREPNPGNYANFYLLFPEIPDGIEPGDLILNFEFRDGTEDTDTNMGNIEGSYTLPVASFAYDDSGTPKYGLLQGKKYLFQVSVSNYVKFTPLGVVPWDYTVQDFDYDI